MQFKLVLLGALLLTAGLIAYSAIPNVQRSPILTSQDIMTQHISVPANSSVTMSRYVAATSAEQNKMILNITVKGEPGESAEIGLMVFLRNDSLPCVPTRPQDYLVNHDVSNETLNIPVEHAGTYCFIIANMPNESDVSDKTVSVSVTLERRSEQILVSRSGSINLAGLGVGAFGFLVFVYGVTRKTVIPWE